MTAPPYIFSSLPTVVAVAPTTTILALIDARQYDYMSVQIENLDLTQTFVGFIQRRLNLANEFATSTLPDFSEVLPGTSVTADLDTASAADMRVIGTMSGAGGDVRITVKDYRRK